jgi:hypothetical protein
MAVKRPVLILLPWPSKVSPDCVAMAAQYSVLILLSWLSKVSPDCAATAVQCPVLIVLPWLSKVQSWLCCHGCSVLVLIELPWLPKFQSWLCCHGCPFLALLMGHQFPKYIIRTVQNTDDHCVFMSAWLNLRTLRSQIGSQSVPYLSKISRTESLGDKICNLLTLSIGLMSPSRLWN